MVEFPQEQVQLVNTPHTDDQIVKILYTNWRGEKAVRAIIPKTIYFGSTQWHPEKQWLLRALDVEKNETRDFALKDIAEWYPQVNPHGK